MYYIKNVTDMMEKLREANEKFEATVSADRKGGCSVSWRSFGSALKAWQFVETVLGIQLSPEEPPPS